MKKQIEHLKTFSKRIKFLFVAMVVLTVYIVSPFAVQLSADAAETIMAMHLHELGTDRENLYTYRIMEIYQR